MIAGSIAVLVLAALALSACDRKDADEAAFDKEFQRDAVFVKECGFNPTLASGPTLKVYRFREAIWFDDRGHWRKIDGKPENVCDLLKPPPSSEKK